MARSDARQRMIISAALLQRERGVPGTGLPEVLKHSGAPRGSVYHHFPEGRDQVAAEATAWAADFLALGLEQLFAEQSPTQALDAFRDIWRRILKDEDYAAGCAVAAAALDYTPNSAARAAAAAGFDRWSELIARALREAGIGEEPAQRLGSVVISTLEGAVILSRAKRSLEPLDLATDHLRAAIESELARADSPSGTSTSGST